MAKLDAIPAEAIVSGFKGTIDFYVWRGIACARSWPRTPTMARSPAVQAQWPIFAIAITAWNHTPTYVRDRLTSQSSPTTLSARDLASKLYINSTAIYPNLTDNAFSL